MQSKAATWIILVLLTFFESTSAKSWSTYNKARIKKAISKNADFVPPPPPPPPSPYPPSPPPLFQYENNPLGRYLYIKGLKKGIRYVFESAFIAGYRAAYALSYDPTIPDYKLPYGDKLQLYRDGRAAGFHYGYIKGYVAGYAEGLARDERDQNEYPSKDLMEERVEDAVQFLLKAACEGPLPWQGLDRAAEKIRQSVVFSDAGGRARPGRLPSTVTGSPEAGSAVHRGSPALDFDLESEEGSSCGMWGWLCKKMKMVKCCTSQ